MKIYSNFLKTFVIFCCLTLSFQSFAQKINGNRQVATEDRSIGTFDAINIRTGIDLHLVQGNENKLVVKADENIMQYVVTEVSNNTLNIYIDGSVKSCKYLDVYLTFKSLSSIHSSQGSDVDSEGNISLDHLEIHATSGSDVELMLNVKDLNCSISSGSDLTLEGRVENLDIEASSGSDFEAKKLDVKNCKLITSSGSDAHVNVSGELSMRASGASDIYYSGNPTIISQKSSGSSDIHGH